MIEQPTTGRQRGKSTDDVFLRRELSGPVLSVARIAAILYALLLLVVYLRWLPRWLHAQADAATSVARLSGGGFPYKEVALAGAGVAIIASLPWVALAILVFVRRSRDLFGLLLAASFLSFGILFTDIGSMIEMERADPWAPWPAAILFLANALILPWAYLFPDGRFVPRWTIALAAVWVSWNIGRAVVGPALDQTALGPLAIALHAMLVASAVFSVAYRYRRQSNPVQRQQIKWVLLGALTFLTIYLLVVPSGIFVASAAQSGMAFVDQTVHSALLSMAVMAIPVALGIAIFRQGLFDIDLIINRALTYFALTAILGIGFIAISALSNLVLGAITGQRSELVLLASVLPVALAFMPARSRALAYADRFVADSRVMTLLFVDIVGSTDRAYALGDRSWRQLLERFRATVRRCLKRCRGREVDTTGDGFFVTFDGPRQALRCAYEMIESVRSLGLQIRVGVHIGAVQVDGKHVEGANVHLAARVMSEAGPGEVLVSPAVRDLLGGSDIELKDRGVRHLKGVPGDVQLYAALA